MKEQLVDEIIKTVAKILTDGSVWDDETRQAIEWKLDCIKQRPADLRTAQLHGQGIAWMVENQGE